jgi:hypothetical protein
MVLVRIRSLGGPLEVVLPPPSSLSLLQLALCNAAGDLRSIRHLICIAYCQVSSGSLSIDFGLSSADTSALDGARWSA